MDFPDYVRLKEEVQIATRSDQVQVLAVAYCRFGIIIQTQKGRDRSTETLLNTFLNHTPPDSLSWNEEQWATAEKYN